jgi:hypothetical protein
MVAGLLNGGVFNGRSIIASDKNRFQSIKIRELAIPPQGIQSQTPHYLPTPPSQYTSPIPVVAPSQYSTSSGQVRKPPLSLESMPRYDKVLIMVIMI